MDSLFVDCPFFHEKGNMIRFDFTIKITISESGNITIFNFYKYRDRGAKTGG